MFAFFQKLLANVLPRKQLDVEQQVDWFARHPPSHLRGLVSPDCPELGLGNGGHGEQIAIGFRLKCMCGEQRFFVSAFLWKRDAKTPETLVSPVRALCSNCKKRIVVFDSDLHGYDAVACEGSTLAHGERERDAVQATVAQRSAPTTVDVISYYPDDLFGEDFDEFADRRSDLFTWISVVVGEDIEPDYPLLSFECA